MKLYIICFVVAICLFLTLQVQSSPLPDVSEDINNALSNAAEAAKSNYEELKPKIDSFIEGSKSFIDNVSKRAQEFFDKGIPKTD